jgi:hypothetical protein
MVNILMNSFMPSEEKNKRKKSKIIWLFFPCPELIIQHFPISLHLSSSIKKMKRYRIVLRELMLISCIFFTSLYGYSQNPEFSLREFASGQIKKGVRSIGMGGDGATWGNYSLVWRDSSTALLDGGTTKYTNNNQFGFTAVGVTLPPLKHGLTFYAIALSQYASNIAVSLKPPGTGNNAIPMQGDGSNQALFIKMAMPLGQGFSFGLLLSYERSIFDAVSDMNAQNYLRYQTSWLPSGGFGFSWQPNNRLLVGLRCLFNNDNETITDSISVYQGTNNTQEYRLGASIGLWKGALIDLGGNIRHRYNQIYGTSNTAVEPNIGFEQNLWQRHFVFRFGLDETSETGGMTLRFNPLVLDLAYVHNLAMARIGNLFGTSSNSILATFVFDFGNYLRKKQLAM